MGTKISGRSKMKLIRLELNNYKIYYGNQVLDLDVPDTPSFAQKRNLILIGGLNGRGKTTILNAIYYVLFGKQGLTDEEYKLTFSGAINDRFFDEGGRDCSVSLTFEDENEQVTVKVTWSFDHRKTLIHENRKVFVRNGNELQETNMTNEEYFDFINRRIPFEVAPYFIFDGEKIQELVAQQDHRLMKRSIQRIVSIEVYKELVEDLSQLQNSLERKLATKQTNRKLNDLLEEIEEYKEKLSRAQNMAKELRAEIAKLEAAHTEISQERRRKLANNTESSLQIQKRMMEYQLKLEEVNKKLTDFAKSGLAKYILAPLIKQMQKTLQEERDYIARQNQAALQYAPYETFMRRLVSVQITPPLTDMQIGQLQEHGKKIWAELNKIQAVQLPKREIIHDIAPGVRNALLSLPTSIHQNIRELLDQKLKYENLIKQHEIQLENAPDPINTDEEDNKLKELSTLLGEKRARLKQASQVIMKANQEIERIRKQYTVTQQLAAEKTEVQAQYELVSNIKTVAQQFVEEVTKLKAQKIKYEFKNILDRLVQKEEDFQDVEFNENDFVIRIYNDRGAEVKLADRSAGEKQIIALSFIWALTKTAGFKLPFVIDTPLGRLDSIHRSHIIRNYFNLLSDQVIILSTDTEINEEYLRQVSNYLVRSYELVYDPEQKSTTIKQGYFSFV
jgi:DNA sulfur modification protein DndD